MHVACFQKWLIIDFRTDCAQAILRVHNVEINVQVNSTGLYVQYTHVHHIYIVQYNIAC